jgi:hypothetical protein|tara:strand:- start:13386 stop:14063 length:678 start_codon:yes stop_codon:yes gene_type:complete
MELIKEYKNVHNDYTKKIRVTKYTEGENITREVEGVKDICEIIISQNDQEYDTVQKTQRKNYIIKKKLEIADAVEKNEKFTKSFNPKLIQRGLQNNNHISSILYMNELYKVNTVIYNTITNKFYKTSFMDYPILFCEYKNNSWHHLEDVKVDENTKYHPISEIPDILTHDTTMMIFKSNMESISKYKIKDLEIMCSENDLETTRNGKKKLKKELYDELSLHYIKS